MYKNDKSMKEKGEFLVSFVSWGRNEDDMVGTSSWLSLLVTDAAFLSQKAD